MVMALPLVENGEEKIYYTVCPTKGVVNGRIANSKRFQSCIEELRDSLEAKVANLRITVKDLYVSFLGGPVVMEEFTASVSCTGLSDDVKVAQEKDIEKLLGAYPKSIQSDGAKILVDYIPVQFYHDGNPVNFDELDGIYGDTIACKFLLFWGPKIDYERLQLAIKKTKLECKRVYLGLRASAAYLSDLKKKSDLVVLDMSYDHSEVGYYKYGKLLKYEWLREASWDGTLECILGFLKSSQAEDFDDAYLSGLDLGKFSREALESGNGIDKKLAAVGVAMVDKYFAPFQKKITGKDEGDWNIDADILSEGGVQLTGAISGIKGLDVAFNKFLEAKECKFKVQVAEYFQNEKLSPCESQDADLVKNSLATVLGLWALVKEDSIDSSKEKTQKKMSGGLGFFEKLAEVRDGFTKGVKTLLGGDLINNTYEDEEPKDQDR